MSLKDCYKSNFFKKHIHMKFEIIPLKVETRGEIITSNLPAFRDFIRQRLKQINRELKTDEEFGQAELDVKALREAEDVVRSAALKVLDDELRALFDGLNETGDEIRVPRLEIEKLIAARKEAVKIEIIEEFLGEFDIDPSYARKHYLQGLQSAMKCKRTLESMRTACRVFQKSSQSAIRANRKSIEVFEKGHGQDLTMDRSELELKSSEYVAGELRRRFEAKKAADERKRLEQEAAAARAAEAKAKAEHGPAKPIDPRNPHNLPPPPKIGSIPVGRAAIAEPKMISVDEEWKDLTKTVVEAFNAIKAHRERLIHEPNKRKILSFGASVNAVWAALKEEVSQ